MSISISNSYAEQLNSMKKETSGDKLTTQLSGMNAATASEAELMEACKSFEQYLVEQVIKTSKEALCPDDDLKDNAYMKTFGDTLYQQYAKIISDNANLGIADMLYKSIKDNAGITVKPEEVEDIVVVPDIKAEDKK